MNDIFCGAVAGQDGPVEWIREGIHIQKSTEEWFYANARRLPENSIAVLSTGHGLHKIKRHLFTLRSKKDRLFTLHSEKDIYYFPISLDSWGFFTADFYTARFEREIWYPLMKHGRYAKRVIVDTQILMDESAEYPSHLGWVYPLAMKLSLPEPTVNIDLLTNVLEQFDAQAGFPKTEDDFNALFNALEFAASTDNTYGNIYSLCEEGIFSKTFDRLVVRQTSKSGLPLLINERNFFENALLAEILWGE